jgi:hypothetical protein
MHRMIVALACFLFCAATALPQSTDTKLRAYQTDLTQAKSSAPGSADRQEAVKHLTNPTFHPTRFALFAMGYDNVLFQQWLNLWEQSRTDKQVGATATGSGSTDLVSLPSAPQLFGLGTSVGALTQTVSGSVATFRGNADGIIRTFAGEPVGCNGCTGTNGLRNISFAVSFDLSRQATQQATTNGSANSATTTAPSTILLPENTKQFSSFTARYDIYNPKDTRSMTFQDAWDKWSTAHQSDLEAAGRTLQDSIEKLIDPWFQNDTKYPDLRAEYTAKLNQASAENIEALLTEYLSREVVMARSDVSNFDESLLNVRAAYASYSQSYEDLFKELRGKPQFSAEYTFNSPVDQPGTHNFRFIFASNPLRGGGLISANAAVTLYGGQFPAGAKYGRLRDFQFAAQFDRPLGNINNYPAVLTLAGYVQYQIDPSVLNIDAGNLVPGTTITLPQDAQVLLGRSGTMGIVQAKVTLKLKNSGVKIPIAVSWANRTDLLNATDVRGHIGLTYDLDSLFGH